MENIDNRSADGERRRETLEVTVARLYERFNSFEKAFLQMASDQRSLSDSYHELVKNNQRISIVESDIINLKESTKTLWTKFDAHMAAHTKTTNHVLFDGVKFVIAVVIGALLSKMNIHM